MEENENLKQQLDQSNNIIKHLNAEKIAIDQSLSDCNRVNLQLRKHIILIEDHCRELNEKINSLNKELESLKSENK